MKTINQDDFTSSLSALLKETFESTDTEFGTMYLDANTGFFATLEKIDAKKASRSASENSTTIAAHCEHTRFYLEFLCNYLNGNYMIVDWKESWNIKTVNEEEWTAVCGSLQKAYQMVIDTFAEIQTWNTHKISGAMGILMHTAYHLSAIRQIMKVTK
jgi:hypothetical protein